MGNEERWTISGVHMVLQPTSKLAHHVSKTRRQPRWQALTLGLCCASRRHVKAALDVGKQGCCNDCWQRRSQRAQWGTQLCQSQRRGSQVGEPEQAARLEAAPVCGGHAPHRQHRCQEHWQLQKVGEGLQQYWCRLVSVCHMTQHCFTKTMGSCWQKGGVSKGIGAFSCKGFEHGHRGLLRTDSMDQMAAAIRCKRPHCLSCGQANAGRPCFPFDDQPCGSHAARSEAER